MPQVPASALTTTKLDTQPTGARFSGGEPLWLTVARPVKLEAAPAAGRERTMTVLQRVSRLARMATARFNIAHECVNTNLYHCCIQKSGSQWIKQVLQDPTVFRCCGLSVHDPGRNFIKPGRYPQLTCGFADRRIVSPLYITYHDFAAMPKPQTYKAFWVMRDPRDVVCSKYFSVRYSHPMINDGMARLRNKLRDASKEDGLMHFIRAMGRQQSPQVICMRSWINEVADPLVLLLRYEDLIGPDQHGTFRTLFDHLDIPIPDERLQQVLRRYSFESLSGHQQGVEDPNCHYRKGLAGDWRNHFHAPHKQAFKQATGSLLADLGYESDPHW